MGSYLVAVPDFADSELVFDEKETREILKFLYPHHAAGIAGMTVNNDVRRFGQSLLVGAIDASYAMGYIQSLGQTVLRPGSGIQSLAKKLAARFVKHWFKHATQQDLLDAKVYESVRNALALSMQTRFRLMLSGELANGRARRGMHAYLAVRDRNPQAWV